MIEKEKIKRIIIRGPNWIGDAVLCTPALSAVRRLFPESHLTLHVKPHIAEVLRGHPSVDEMVLYDADNRHRGLSGTWRMMADLREGRYDMGILFQNAFEAALLLFLARVPIRYGYRTDGRGLLLTHGVSVRKHDPSRHQADYYLGLISPLGGEEGHPHPPPPEADQAVGTRRPALVLAPQEREDAQEFLQDERIGRDDLLIGLNPGAAYGPAKRWATERYAVLADRLMKDLGAKVLIFGGPQEMKLCTEIAKGVSQKAVVVSGRATLREAMALIAGCRVFVTNDSGPMHIAAAFGVPVVAIFGPTNPSVTSPLGNGHTILRHPVPCSPCTFRVCPIDHPCMERITVDEVFDAVRQQCERSTVRQIAVFMDRDGTINREVGHVDTMEKLELIPGTAAAIRRVNQLGIKAIVVTNQSGIGRGYFSEEFMHALHGELQRLMEKEGTCLDAIYYCPHLPGAGCGCRKPAPGMLYKAAEEHGIDLTRSFVVGDKLVDVVMAHRVGAKGILVLTGFGGKEPGHEEHVASGTKPDYTARDLSEAVSWILADVEKNFIPIRGG